VKRASVWYGMAHIYEMQEEVLALHVVIRGLETRISAEECVIYKLPMLRTAEAANKQMLRTAEAALEFAFLHDTSLNTRSLTRTTKALADEKEIKKAYDAWLLAD